MIPNDLKTKLLQLSKLELYKILFYAWFVLLRHRLKSYFYHRKPRAHVHWIGNHRRLRRLERPLMVFVFLGALILLEPREVATWSAMWGGATSIFILLHTIFILIPRKHRRQL